MIHKLIHRFVQRYWETAEHLPVPGYAKLIRQRCTVCGETRVQDLS
jgi:hypothetical protein